MNTTRYFSHLRPVSAALVTLLWLPTSRAAAEISAEVWPLLDAAPVSSRLDFEQRRSQAPAHASILNLDHLEIPERKQAELVRVRGSIIPPVSGQYFLEVIGADAAELWMMNPTTSEWKLMQANGNPRIGPYHCSLQQGEAQPFEFWTMGSGKVSVHWHCIDRSDPKIRKELVANGPIPGTCLSKLNKREGERFGDGLKDAWKEKSGLNPESGDGLNGPWGDPDLDKLLNWQEQIAGTNPLKADAEGAASLVRWEIWRDVPGRYVYDLTRDSGFPAKPDEVRYLSRLELPVGSGNDYGARVRGLLTAPASGEYTVMIIADDTAEFWLGETESFQSKRLVARVNQPGAESRWHRRSEKVEKPLLPEQVAKVHLEQGKRYYLEILHKQSNKTDHCSVAWIVPGSTTREVIGGKALTAWRPDQQDADDDSLPDAWQKSYDFDKKDASLRGAQADLDGDGVSNWDEWKSGKNPLVADAINTEHLLRCETWLNLAGHRLKDLETDALYPTAPTVSKLIDNMDFSDEGEDYGCRLRGYITAPEDGSYIFYVSGNDSSLLYLADSSDKFTKRVIAQTSRGTEWRSFSGTASQESEPILLKKGNRYYIEVLFKRGARLDKNDATRDHASVAWKRPGRLQSVIDPEFFSPYLADPRDTDDDDLADEWERAHDLDAKSASGTHGSWGDPDEDGLDNFREFQMGLDPHVADVHGVAGLALWEYWENVTGGLESFKAHPAFPLNPTERKWITRLEGPQNIGKFYGSRMRAYLIPPSTGEYTFALSGDNECELSLSASEDKITRQRIAHVTHFTAFREWDAEKEKQQRSQPVTLEAGKRYFIEILHTESTISDHVSAAWKIPGSNVFTVIDGKSLAAFAQDRNDLDDDDLPDDWETRYRLDHTDPRGDNGPHGDPDHDGFSNTEELRLGTNPNNRDTDGDGIFDYDEIHTYHTNPLVKDTVPPVELLRFPLAVANFQTSAPWVYGNDGSLTSVNRRGSLSFEFDLEKPGIHAITLVANASGSASYIPAVPVSVTVSGMRIGNANFPAVSTSRTWLTPWLPAGRHVVIVENHNVRANVGLTIHSLVLSHFDGKDLNAHGIPQWLANTLLLKNSVSTLPLQSAVSPCFIEGVCRFPASVSAAVANQPLSVLDHMSGHWHTNVPLNPDASATQLQLNFENGTQSETHEILWIPTNLAQAPQVNHLRLGDSIRVVAHDNPTDTFTLRHGDKIWEKQSPSDPVTITFDQPGSFTLEATWAQGSSASVVYHVHHAEFGDPVAVPAGGSRVWTPKNVTSPLEIQADQGITLTPTEASSKAYLVSNASTTSGSIGVVARLPGHGAILATGTIDSFILSSGSKTGDARLVGVHPDGTRVIEVTYIIDGPVPADLSIWIRLYVTDAVFANGLTWLQLTAADFDENGVAKFRVLKAPGTGTPYVCHWILPYSDFEDVLNLRQPR